MKSAIAVLLFLCMSVVSFAQVTTLTLNPLNTTFAFQSNYSSSNIAIDENSTTNGNLPYFYYDDANSLNASGFSGNSLIHVLRFNTSVLQNKIIVDANLTAQLEIFGDCSDGSPNYKSWYNLYNYAWNGSETWSQLYPISLQIGTSPADVFSATDARVGSGNFSFSAYGTMSDGTLSSAILRELYGNNGLTSYIGYNGGSCYAVGRVDNNYARLYNGDLLDVTYTLADYVSGHASGTGKTVYADFERALFSTTSLSVYTYPNNSAVPYQDFVFDIENATIFTSSNALGNSVGIVNSADYTDTLPLTTCGANEPFYTAATVFFNAQNYQTYCFRLSPQHNGKYFYGAIKILNNTQNSYDFYWALYSPSYVTFSTPSITPAIRQAGTNVTVRWTTSQNISTTLRFQYMLQNGNTWSPWFSVTNSALNLSHEAVIPSSFVFGGIYNIVMYGTDANNFTYNSDNYSFSVTGVPTAFSNYPLTISVVDINGIPISSQVVLDGQVISVTRLENGLQVTTYPNVSIGYHNITAVAIGGSGATGNNTIYVNTLPFFTTLTLSDVNACYGNEFFATGDLCNSTMSSKALPSGATYYSCVYNPNQNTCSPNQANCTISAGDLVPPRPWVGYICYGSGFIDGATTNGTTPFFNQTSLTGGQGITPTIGNFLGGFFGTNASSALAFLGILISTTVAAYVGYKSKSGTVSGISFVGFIFVFTFINWIPLWVMLMMSVLTAFLVAKFGKSVVG